MSFVFDTMQRAIETIPDEQVQNAMRWVVDRLHEINHDMKDKLNHDTRLLLEAQTLSKALDELQRKGPK